jgi:hypothetical protein
LFGSGSDIAQENAALVASVRAISAQPPDQPVPLSFLRRYLQVARSISPLLTENSQRLVAENFSTIRSEQVARGGYAITYRTLDSMIRLATAHAKLRLSQEISEEDVLVATQLVRNSALISQVTAAARNEEEEEQLQQHQLSDVERRILENNNNDMMMMNFGGLGRGATASNAAADAAIGDEQEDRFRMRARRFEDDNTTLDTNEMFGNANPIVVVNNNNASQQSSTSATLSVVGAGGGVSAQTLRNALQDVLARLKREKCDQVALHELRDRIQQLLGHGIAVSLPAVKQAAKELDSEQYVYEDSDDVLYLV